MTATAWRSRGSQSHAVGDAGESQGYPTAGASPCWKPASRGHSQGPGRSILVPCLTRGSLAPVTAAAAGGGLVPGFLPWASPAAAASAALALEADTAARTAAAPGALCFLFLPPMLRRVAEDSSPPRDHTLHDPRLVLHEPASSIRGSPALGYCSSTAIGPPHRGPRPLALSPPGTCRVRAEGSREPMVAGSALPA